MNHATFSFIIVSFSSRHCVRWSHNGDHCLYFQCSTEVSNYYIMKLWENLLIVQFEKSISYFKSKFQHNTATFEMHPKWTHQIMKIREDIKIKKTVKRVKLASFTLPPSPTTLRVKNKRMKYCYVWDPPSPQAKSDKFGRF